MSDKEKIDERMRQWQAYLQPFIDGMNLTPDQLDAVWDNLRSTAPGSLEKETLGIAWWQIANLQQRTSTAPKPDPEKVAQFMIGMQEKMQKYRKDNNK